MEDDVPNIYRVLDQIVFQRTETQPAERRRRKRPHPEAEAPGDAVATEIKSSVEENPRRLRVSCPDGNETASPPSAASRDTTATSSGGWLERARQRRDAVSAPVIVPICPSPTSKRLGFIKLDRMRDLSFQAPHESRVSSLGFISRGGETTAYSTGVDKCIKLYTLTAKDQTLTHTVHVKNSPIYGSATSHHGQSLICLSDRCKVFSLDIESRSVSKFPRVLGMNDNQAYKAVKTYDGLVALLDDRGKIYVLDERTLKTLKIFTSGTMIRSLIMTSNKIYSGDDGGEVFEWDLRMGRCSARHVIEGSLGVQSLVISSNNRIVVGTDSGYVSLYDLEPDFKLVKSFGNLCTPSDVLAPSPHFPLVLGASSRTSDALRLFNVGETPYVYQNFPGEKSRSKRVTCAAFSDSDGWMAVGNDRGIVKLWRLPMSL
eukprot:Gregarina_sp_Poly_1__1274@NODE_130_length_13255_cov_150_516454_g116_i0_p5_GENE_NODE_130_length_13255_cov_150_516454_g116_i0NODE_130_length_13255_cov_150_516454_g116_i0_p5_ORF_typecomplete_len430_score53_96ANAPC4_WD40/PF12894_7/15ANAPC4_WD40/PF12894_7/0_45ANAPC4_WD40/PF12894_7/0_054PQQ_2/PF13360_6/1_6PQQ_2/PF13360_6/0_013VID27/PF08553_10/2_2e03VID27/PF08553_10/0_0061VID27/PF08553_10/8_1WD40_like/PF17005_5/0_0052WD40_like/PF17005_5/18Cytochrom_D1/PF02239_16/2_4e02Cytochrom_D1/PF02239_16/0_03Ge1_WD